MKQHYAMSPSTTIKFVTHISLCLFILLVNSGCEKQSPPLLVPPQPVAQQQQQAVIHAPLSTQPTNSSSIAPIMGMEKNIPNVNGMRPIASLSETITTPSDPTM